MLRTQKMTKNRFKNLDEKYMGLEPSWDQIDDTISDHELDEAITNALKWYQHFHDFGDSLKFLNQYFKKNKIDNTNLKRINNADILIVGRTVGFLAKMYLKNIPRLSTRYITVFTKQIKTIEDLGKQRKPVVDDNAPKKNVISVQQRINDVAKSLVHDIDDVIEIFQDSGYETTFTFKAFAQINKIKKPTARKMIVLLQERLEEYENKQDDPDLKEAYRHLKKREKNKIIKLLKECVDGCTSITQQKTRRLKRKR